MLEEKTEETTTDAAAGNAGAAEQPARVLYDADLPQLVGVTIEDEAGSLEFNLRAFPLTDELIRAYVTSRDERRAKLGVPFRADPLDPTGHQAGRVAAHVGVAAEFFPRFIERAELEGDVPPLGDLFGAQDMLAVIDQLLSRELLPPPDVKKSRPLKSWPGGRRVTTTRVGLRCAFNDGRVQYLDTAHFFRKPGADVYAEFARGVLDTATELEELETLGVVYDKLSTSRDGYKGRVPLHHKPAAVRGYLQRFAQVTQKN